MPYFIYDIIGQPLLDARDTAQLEQVDTHPVNRHTSHENQGYAEEYRQ